MTSIGGFQNPSFTVGWKFLRSLKFELSEAANAQDGRAVPALRKTGGWGGLSCPQLSSLISQPSTETECTGMHSNARFNGSTVQRFNAPVRMHSKSDRIRLQKN